jgi:hypothetical protein
MAFRKADESLVCSDKKLDSFFKPALIIMFKNKYNF